MDERKKIIRDLEDKRREALGSVDLMWENLGASLLPHLEQDDNSEYRRLLREISDSEERIHVIEEDLVRLRNLEDTIQKEELESAGQAKELSKHYSQLGENILEEEDCIDAVRPYQDQADTLISKIDSLEERLDQLEERGDGNVFAWIGKSTQSVVLRSFLSRSQGNLQKVYALAGDRYAQATPSDTKGGELRAALESIETLKRASSELSAGLAKLREERRRIVDSFGAEGSPPKRIQTQERIIAHSREQLRLLYLRYGKEAEDGNDEAAGGVEAAGLEGSVEASARVGEIQLLASIRKIRKTIANYEREIEKLKASLEIDEENAAVEKMERTIGDHRKRIEACEEAIKSLARQIEEAKARIEELAKVL
jgi:chromosome segregation ATPase